MFANAIIFLVKVIFSLLTFAFLLRFYFQLTRVSFSHPLSQTIVQVTSFAVKPIRKIIPSAFGMDLSTLLLAVLTQFLMTFITLWLQDFPLWIAGDHIWLIMLGLAGLGVISMSVSIFMIAVLLQAVLSWVNPHTAIAPILHQITSPILNRLRRMVQPIGMLDLSALVFIITAQLILSTLLIPLEIKLYAML
jgi:YggT family protein